MSTATLDQVTDVVSRASSDASFRAQLLSAPAATLAGAGVALPSGVDVQVVENTASDVYFVLPPRPADVSDADLQQIASSSDSGTSVAEQLDTYGRLVVAAWRDPSLKSQLLSDPATVLASHGISVSKSMTPHVLEASATLAYLVLPQAGS